MWISYSIRPVKRHEGYADTYHSWIGDAKTYILPFSPIVYFVYKPRPPLSNLCSIRTGIVTSRTKGDHWVLGLPRHPWYIYGILYTNKLPFPPFLIPEQYRQTVLFEQTFFSVQRTFLHRKTKAPLYTTPTILDFNSLVTHVSLKLAA